MSAREESTIEEEGDYFDSYTRDVKRREEEILSVIDGGPEPGAVSHLVCKKCKGRKVRYVLIQTRSADEASSAFFQCKSCDFRWNRR